MLTEKKYTVMQYACTHSYNNFTNLPILVTPVKGVMRVILSLTDDRLNKLTYV